MNLLAAKASENLSELGLWDVGLKRTQASTPSPPLIPRMLLEKQTVLLCTLQGRGHSQ